MQFRVLGPLEVDAGDGALPLGGPKQRAVLANLLVRANEVVPADTLIEEIWGDEPPAGARNTLQTYVSNLRKTLGEGILQGRDPGYVMVLDPLDVDATRFDALVRDARKTLPVDPKVAIDTLEDALAMWRGPALADVAERSLLAEAARLDEQRMEAQEERIGALLAAGWAARAIGELEPLLARHPLRERLWEQLMLAFYREGRQAEALAAFQRAREILADELGIDPSAELARLHGLILAQDLSLELRGEPLRGYRLLEKLGETSSGIRFRAIQPRVGRDVEVEVFHEHLASTQAFVERFEPEAQAVAALEHPYIVPIYDYWREPGRAYVVRRYLRGSSLRAVVERGEELDRGRALQVIEQVSSALAFAHRQGVAHGDVDDANVIFDADGNAYVTGFSIGAGSPPSAEDDVHRLGSIVRRLLGGSLPELLAELLDGADGSQPVAADAFADAARAALATSVPQTAVLVDDPLRNPYRGLRPFSEADASDFFGRSMAVGQVVERLLESGPNARFVAVVGPSGCGKSSLVRAGVVPALRDGALGEPVLATELSPGPHPYDELEAALGRVSVRAVQRLGDLVRGSSRGLLEAVKKAIPGDADVVIVIDQFEELFTLTETEAERADFLECIRVACADPESRVRVIATLRADHYDRPLVYPRFGELLASRTEAIAPLQPDELEQAIRGPAERAGVHPEPGLVADMIADAAHQPGSLPLIQFTLTELFDRRSDGAMTLATYRDLGGIVGTLASSADQALRQAGRDERRAIRQIFLRLVALGEGRRDTRRRVTRSTLGSLNLEDTTIDHVLETFGRLRILTFDREPASREPTVEIAHEALLDAWPRLRGWIDEAREDLRQERVLARAASEWAAAGQDPSFLLRGARLEQAEGWVGSTGLALGHDVRRYVAAAAGAREEERLTDERRRAHEAEVERRAARRLRALVAVFAVAALVAGSLTLVATGQSRRASREAAISGARELAAASVANLDDDPERAVLLAMEAVERSRAATGAAVPEAVEALHRAIAASRIVATIPGLSGPVATSVDGSIAAQEADGPGRVAILDPSGALVRAFGAHEGRVTDMAFTPDGTSLITTGTDGWLRVWDAESDSLLWERHGSREARGIALDVQGSLVAARWPSAGRVVVARADTGRVVRTLRVVRTFDGLNHYDHVALSPDGSRIAIVMVERNGDDGGRIVPTIGRGRGVAFRAPPFRGINGPLSWSPDGRLLSGSAYVWDSTTGELLYTAWQHDATVITSDWSPDGERLVTGSIDGSAKVWEVGSTEFRSTLAFLAAGGAGAGAVTDVAFTADGQRIVTASDAVRIWDVRPVGDGERAGLSLPTIWSGQVEFTPSGSRLIIVADDGKAGAGLLAWDLGAPAPTPFGLSLTLPIAPFEVNPVDGSVIQQRRGGVLALVEGTSVSRPPIETAFASWAPDGAHLVVSPTQASIALVGLDGREVWRRAQPLSIGVLEVGPDGTIAIAGADADPDRVVVVLDGADGSEIATLPTHATSVAIDPRGGRIVTQDEDGPIRIWDVASAQLLGSFPEEARGRVSFSPDGSTLAVIGRQEVRLYDTDTRELRLTLPAPAPDLGHEFCYGGGLAFSPDGALLAAQDCDGVRVWTLDIDELLAIARTNVTRSLTSEECRQYLHVDPCP